MNFIAANIKWIMLVSGALTCTMVYAAIAPQSALRASFGVTLEGAAADIVVRNWGVLITLVGAMLIYGAFNPPVRRLALIIAGTSKLVFIGLVLSHGALFLGHQAGIAIAVDALWVVLFACYLLGERAGVNL
jgi:hypothetical protein